MYDYASHAYEGFAVQVEFPTIEMLQQSIMSFGSSKEQSDHPLQEKLQQALADLDDLAGRATMLSTRDLEAL